ncbi:MAG: hypothetical protein EOO65_00665 [Methanosarcinales archaeon]|nr:MAG: hypothetical protein EOO65_00665 [Methanosarcinales archaeon]
MLRVRVTALCALQSGRAVAQMVDAEVEYTYEYQGNAQKLVHTPLTDKCYMVLTQGLHMGLGGNPYGPAGTGKTESVKALGAAVGRQVLVFGLGEFFLIVVLKLSDLFALALDLDHLFVLVESEEHFSVLVVSDFFPLSVTCVRDLNEIAGFVLNFQQAAVCIKQFYFSGIRNTLVTICYDD